MDNAIMSGRNIVIVGQQPWDTEIGSNCKDIALEFSKHNRVVYVNSPLDRNTVLKSPKEGKIQKRLNVIAGKEKGLNVVLPNFWVLYPDVILESINWLPDSFLYTYLNKQNNKRFAKSIKNSLQQLGFNNFLLFNDNDIFRSFYLKELLQPELSIYYSRDNMLAVDYWQKHGRKLEPALIAKSDVCVANSSYLASYCKKYNPHSYFVGQGCDFVIPAAEQKISLPQALANIKKPIIGYVGALVNLRLDIDILAHISNERKDWSVVLVGPEDDAFKASVLHQLPNVHFLGPKSPTELTSYISHFDVCLNPQLVNPMTIGNYPRKIDEYLALGKPVVATQTEAMEIFKDYTYLANTPADYVQLIDRALQEDKPELRVKRQAFAATHTWENSVQQIYAAIRTCQQASATTSPMAAVAGSLPPLA